MDEGGVAGPAGPVAAPAGIGVERYPVAFPALQIMCDAACGANPVEIIETRYPAAVTLYAMAENPEVSNIIMNSHMEDFATIMEDEDELSDRIAFENSISTQNDNEIDSNYGPIIIGKSRIPVAPAVAPAVANANYTKLIAFISFFTADNQHMITLNSLMFYLHVLIYGTFGIQGQQPVLIYSNILLVRNPNRLVDSSSLMPKYSFNLLCVKEPLLQTRLTAGRENGMGALLERFICKLLQPFLDTIAPAFTKVKLIAPTESNNIWQIKLSVFENDFILVSLQIINVKAEYLTHGNIIPFEHLHIPETYGNLIIPPLKGPGWTINADVTYDNGLYLHIMPVITAIFRGLQQQLNANLLRYCSHNLCFSLYNKCLSKDFNCLCSLSEVDTKMLKEIVGSGGFNNFYIFIQSFLNNLVDTLINKKKQYFLFGLLNLISCSYQDKYTLETKAYELIFDKAPPNLNLFLNSMRLIEKVNSICAGIPIPINIVMGGGKQYSLFQIALNNYFNTLGGSEDTSYFIETFNTVDFVNQGGETTKINGDKIVEFLYHANVKPAADADFGMFHPGNDIEDSPETALGSTMCMSVCMLLQMSLKKLIDGLFVREPLTGNYDIDIGNSCIGNPPTTLSSLRINLHSSKIFYTGVKTYLETYFDSLVAAGPAVGPVVYAIRAEIRILDADTEHIPPIASVISPYDFVLKGSMQNYIVHILDAIYEFNPGGTGAFLTRGQKIGVAEILTPFMFTSQGFSSPLKGIFDIFYTLFIIENFANRSLVTQKINKELKRIAICAQVLYIHFVQIRNFEILRVYPAPMVPLVPAQENNPTLVAIYAIMHTLQRMILIGYNGSTLLDAAGFAGIMNTYVTFTDNLIQVTGQVTGTNRELLFYCAPHNPTGRTLTSIENYFMNFLVYSSPNPPPPPPPSPIGTLADTVVVAGNAAAPVAGIPVMMTEIDLQNPSFRSLTCIPDVITALNGMGGIVHSLYKNKLYAACRDSVNKKEGVIAIASAYQSFLWNTFNSMKIIGEGEPDFHCFGKRAGAKGIDGVLVETHNIGLNNLIGSLNPCWSGFPEPNSDLLNLNTVLVPPHTFLDGVQFNNDANDNLGRFLIFSWFITSIFGIKTKSKPSKILALGRTYLKLFVESYRVVVASRQGRPENELFGCMFAIPLAIPLAIPQLREPHVPVPGDYFDCTNNEILCLTYGSRNINEALTKYREIEGEHGVENVKKIFVPSQPNGRPNPFQLLGINYTSDVFQNEILQQFLKRFSIFPNRKEFTIMASTNMGILLRELHAGITHLVQASQSSQPVNFPNLCQTLVSRLFPRVQELNIYTPAERDTSKFENFPSVSDVCNSIYFRTKWIIYLVKCILNAFLFNSPQDAPSVYRNMKLFILLLKYLINQEEIAGLEERIIGIVQVQDVQIPDTIAETLANVGLLINSEYPNIEPACILSAKAIVENEATPKVIKKSKLTKNHQQTAEAVKSTRPRVAEAAAIAANLRDAKLKSRRNQGGGNTNNHTRRNKNKRKKNSKSKTKTKFKTKSSPKHRKAIPSSRSGSQSNRKKYKPKKSQKNVTFKRRRARK